MVTVTRWAGRHPLFVRIVLLPILFYIQGRIAFTAGARLFFDDILLPIYWLWGMIAILWITTSIYPANARALLHTAYWRIKGLEWIACTAAFGLWFYAGNQMARQVDGNTTRIEPTVTVAGLVVSESRSDITTLEPDAKHENKLKKAYRNYFKNAINRIKRTHRSQKMPLGLGIALGVIGIGLGIVFLVCGIQCGSTGGAVALGVIGGIALAGLGIWALVAGLSGRNKG